MHIICFTGTRADYGILRPALMELHRDPRFHLELVVTGMHLLPEFGNTWKEVTNDPVPVIAMPSILMKGDSLENQSKSLGIGLLYFGDILQRCKPNCVLLLGDRPEILAAAIAAHYQNIGIVHLHGGEQSGSADDAVRHAISKLAHLHFVASIKAKQFLQHMGESEWRIVPIGSLRKQQINCVRTIDTATTQLWNERYGLESMKNKILLCMHPDSKEPLSYNNQIDYVLDAVRPYAAVSNIYLIGPNSDPGGELFREKLLSFASENANVAYIPSVPNDEFLFLLQNVDLLMGNSSSAIIESPFFGLPAINIGGRQNRRETADNVLHVPFDSMAIQQAIQQQLSYNNSIPCSNPYDLCENPERELVEQLNRLAQRPEVWNKLR